ncbi:hypothetical protein D4R42_01130 [bacterium]|nr:MAG: hypothetical protein D4R42_01130 [bacterium]
MKEGKVILEEKLKEYRSLSEEKRGLEKRMSVCKSKIIFVETVIMYKDEKPTTEQKLLSLMKKALGKCSLVDLWFYDFSREDTDIYIIGKKKDILHNAKEIAKQIERKEECIVKGIGVSFRSPGKYTFEDIFKLC